jgi:DNA repair exonuclease SbcCD ATPase subunit
MQGESDQRRERGDDRVRGVLERLRGEVASLESKCSVLRSKNVNLERTLASLEEESREASRERGNQEEQFKSLQSEYRQVLGKFGQIIEDLGLDPFEDRKFVSFLTAMAEKDWEPTTVLEVANETNKLTERVQHLEEEIGKYESREASLNKSIDAKRERIAKLEDELKALADNLGQAKEEPSLRRPNFTNGAPHLRIRKDDVERLKPDENLLVVLFRELKLSRSVIGSEPSEIFLMMRFLDQEPIVTHRVDVQTETLDLVLHVICKNDLILATYFRKSAVPVQLCRDRNGTITEIGATELNLMPFTENMRSFSCNTELWGRSGKAIGSLSWETSLHYPLVEE